MKRILCLTLIVMLIAASASAAVLTDAPATPTQDRAASVLASWRKSGASTTALQDLPADGLTVTEAMKAYYFVYEGNNRPVEWYPEETQKAIAEMVDDPDALSMTEMMRLHASDVEEQDDLDGKVELEIAYQPGQTTVVVLGDTSDPDNIIWTALETQVSATGEIEFIVPQELMEQLQNKDLLLTVLTVRGYTRTYEVTEEVTTETDEIPSVDAESTTRVVKTVRNGETAMDDFEIVVVPETVQTRTEIEMISKHVTEDKQSALSWLPEDAQMHVRYLLGDAADNLIISDYITLNTRDFHDTDGDAIGTFTFATPYEEGTLLVTALGVSKSADEITSENATQMDWVVQPAIVRDGGRVDIIFDQMALIDMGTQTGLLLVFSEPETEEEE